MPRLTLTGVRDLADVGLTVRSDPRVGAASRLTYGGIDVTRYHRLGFDMRDTCPRGIAGADVRLAGVVAGHRVARAVARVRCVAASSAAPAAEPNPRPQVNLNAQTGVATQERETQHLGYADQEAPAVGGAGRGGAYGFGLRTSVRTRTRAARP